MVNYTLTPSFGTATLNSSVLATTVGTVYKNGSDSETTLTQFFRGIFSITLLVELVLSVFGGFFVCKVITKHNLVWRTVWIYLFALAAADIGVALTAIPLLIITTIYEDLLTIRFFCNMSGAVQVFFLSFSVMTVAMISIHKYISVSRPLQALRRKVYRDVIAYLLISLTCSMFLALAPVVGFSAYTYREGHKMCLLYSSNAQNHTAYSLVILSVSIAIPLLFIFISTVGICCEEKGNREMILDAFFSTPLSSKSCISEDESKTVTTMTLIITSSLMMWGPLFVYYVLDYLKIATPLWYCHLAYLCMLLHGALNPLIYFRHKSFKDDLKGLIKRFCCCFDAHDDEIKNERQVVVETDVMI